MRAGKIINDDFAKWRERSYRNEESGHAKVTRGKKHEFLGMPLDCAQDEAYMVDVNECADQLKEYFPCPLKKEPKHWNDEMPQVDNNSKYSDEVKAKVFHDFTVKCTFMQERQTRRRTSSRHFGYEA